MSSEPAVQVRGLSKCFQIYGKPHDRLKQSLYPRLQRIAGKTPHRYYREFWALRDINFDIERGQTVGVIGRNGSGKSTLLQIICGTLNPTGGTVRTRGRIAALLELGSGFNPDFTGRENVFLNAAILGLSQSEIEARYDEIAAFADIGEFLHQPVKTYSSGMMVRLAFAVIAHVQADILVVDEALAVGDAFFTQKCMRFIRRFQSDGGTILFVSHDMVAVTSICQTALLLFPGAGHAPLVGPAEVVCKEYLSQLYDDPGRQQQVETQRASGLSPIGPTNANRVLLQAASPERNMYSVSGFRTDAEQFGQGAATIVDAGFFDDANNRMDSVEGGRSARFVVTAQVHRQIPFPAIGIMIKDRLGQYLHTEGTDRRFRERQLVFAAGQYVRVNFRFLMPILLRGQYTMNVAFAEGIGDDHIQHHWLHDALKLEALCGPVANGIGGVLDSEITMELFTSAQESRIELH
jgi:lipopolysaccharide transport system ATP-binding protein